jgi:hypothetical protein
VFPNFDAANTLVEASWRGLFQCLCPTCKALCDENHVLYSRHLTVMKVSSDGGGG